MTIQENDKTGRISYTNCRIMQMLITFIIIPRLIPFKMPSVTRVNKTIRLHNLVKQRQLSHSHELLMHKEKM